MIQAQVIVINKTMPEFNYYNPARDDHQFCLPHSSPDGERDSFLAPTFQCLLSVYTVYSWVLDKGHFNVSGFVKNVPEETCCWQIDYPCPHQRTASET